MCVHFLQPALRERGGQSETGEGGRKAGEPSCSVRSPRGPFAFDKTQCAVILRSHWRGETNGFVILTVRFKGMRINNRQILQTFLSSFTKSVTDDNAQSRQYSSRPSSIPSQ